jgi:hypothetical protein
MIKGSQLSRKRTTDKVRPLQFAARRAQARRAALARPQQKTSAVRSTDDICEALDAVVNDIGYALPESEREAFRARLEMPEDSSVVRFPGTDPAEKFFGAVIEYAWRAGSPMYAQRAIDLKEQFDAGRPPA